MRDFLGSVRFKILVAILTVLIGFMIAAIYSGGAASIVSQVIGLVTVPVQRFSASVTGGVADFFDKYLDTARTYEENAILRDQIAELRRELADYEKIRHEYEQLREIEDIREQRRDLVFVTAAVIGRDYSNDYGSFTIDKGTLDEVSLHDPVMSGDGLVGYITEVGLSSARVTTILNVSMNVGASNSATRDVGNVTGSVDLAAEGLCRLEYLPRDSATAPGDVIITSGGDLFPKDLIIGTVTSVSASVRGNSLEATIRPAAGVQGVKDVFVITHFEGKGAG